MQDVLLFAVAAALTPTAILAGLLLLLTARPRRNGGAYLIGWMTGLFAAATILLRLGSDPTTARVFNEEPRLRSGIVLLAGLAMIVAGVLGVRARRRQVKEPGWMRRVDSFSPGLSFGLGFFLGALSPKLLLLTGATVVTLVTSGDSPPRQLAGLLIYILIASLPILMPVAIVFREPGESAQRLSAWKAWLVDHQGRILGGGSILIGLLLIAYALGSAGGAA